MKVKLLEPIEGFEDVAELRLPNSNEPFWWDAFNKVDLFDRKVHAFRAWLVLTPIKRWRPATIDDVCRAIRGETVGARFRNYDSETWEVCEICGYDKKDSLPWRSRSQCFIQCEVLDA